MKIGYIRSSSQKEILAFQSQSGTEKLFCDLDPACDAEFNEMLESLNREDTLIIKDINNACKTIDALLAILDKHFKGNINVTSLSKDLDIFLNEDGFLSFITIRDFILAKQIASTQSEKKLGRKMIAWPSNFRRVADDYISGTIKTSEALNALGMKKATFYTMIKIYKY